MNTPRSWISTPFCNLELWYPVKMTVLQMLYSWLANKFTGCYLAFALNNKTNQRLGAKINAWCKLIKHLAESTFPVKNVCRFFLRFLLQATTFPHCCKQGIL